MKQEISALMDGEMFEDQAEMFFDRLKQHPEGREDWAHYHLIGDVLRQQGDISRDISVAFRERLALEPVMLAPQRRTESKLRHYALSAVASVMALALVVWLSVQVKEEPAPRVAAITTDHANSVQPVSFRAADYLMAHQEFSPSAGVESAANYMHAVAGR